MGASAMFFAIDPGRYMNQVVDNGHCVRFCQIVAKTLPHTSRWARGKKVRGGQVPPLAIVATFNTEGRYANAIDGTSHAAVFLHETSEGIEVWDQWQGQPVHRRIIRFRDGASKPVNDGDRFYVVESAPSVGAEPERAAAVA